MTEQIPVNQTQFSFEEPIFENPELYIDETQQPVEKPKSKKKFLFIGIGVFVFVFILLILIITVLAGRKKEEVTDGPVREVTETKELSPIEERIEDSRELLDLADPTKQDLSFPPVDLKIRLDKKEK